MSTVEVNTSVLRAIADTLEARADTDQPLTVAELRGLSDALRDLVDAGGDFRGPSDVRVKDRLILLRPTLGRPSPK